MRRVEEEVWEEEGQSPPQEASTFLSTGYKELILSLEVPLEAGGAGEQILVS
jgi:hypothetical protein